MDKCVKIQFLAMMSSYNSERIAIIKLSVYVYEKKLSQK